jgi:hypothetical protein
MTDVNTETVADVAPAAPVEAPAAEVASEAPAPTEQQTIDQRLEAIWDRDNPPRAPDGKFASRNPETVEAQETDTETTDQPLSETEGQVETPETAAPVTDPPQAWSAAMKEMWTAVPPEARDYIAKRETEVTKTLTRMGQELAQYRPLNELFERHRDTFSRHGTDAQSGIARLLDAQNALDRDPYSAIAAIAESYQVDLTAFAGQQQPDENGNQAPPDPYVQRLEQQLNQLTQRLSERERSEREHQESQTRELQRQTDEEVGKWSDGKDHFEEASVKKLMAAAIRDGEANTLDEAYDMACNAIPSIRQKLRETERKTEEAKRLAETKKHASEAKRSASVNAGSTARRVASVPSGKWDSDSYLESVYDRAQQGS